MSVEAFLKRLREAPDEIEFADTIAVIDSHYDYTPTAFRNGDVHNEAGQNAGSCKLLSFAKLQGLSEAETLACFGCFYRSEEHTSELQSLMRISYAVFCLKKKKNKQQY